ncbi:MAG: RDD family protein, partial [Candidatus Heimdallarchaeota archaeon]
ADRCVAYLIDEALGMIFSWAACGGCIYTFIKDGVRDGRSIGKGMMGLRVVKFDTGQPPTITDSCLRNCLACCPPLLLFTEGRRRFGDFVAGTIVIKDV